MRLIGKLHTEFIYGEQLHRMKEFINTSNYKNIKIIMHSSSTSTEVMTYNTRTKEVGAYRREQLERSFEEKEILDFELIKQPLNTIEIYLKDNISHNTYSSYWNF